jgi:predicted Zn-dependent protease
MRRGDSIRAEHYFSLAIENGYNKSDILPELLTVCLSSSRLRSALNYAEPFLRQHPKDARLRYLVATVYVGLGQTAVAKQELETVLRHEPSFAAAYFLLAMLELPTDESRAKAHWERYLALQPTGDKATEARERLEALDAASRAVRVSADRQQSWENTLTTSLEETTTRGEQL